MDTSGQEWSDLAVDPMHIRCKPEEACVARRSKKRGFGQLTEMRSGRIQARYTGPDGALHTAHSTFEDEDAAITWLTSERRLIEQSPDEWTPPRLRRRPQEAEPDVLTFGDYAATWLKTRKVRGRPLAAKTKSGYLDLLNRFILPTFADVALTAIDSDMIDTWYETTAVTTPTYRAHAYSLLRTILGTAVHRDLITSSNPAKVRGAGSTRAAHKVRPATPEELGLMLEAMPERRRLMLLLATWSTLRFGEITELRRKDIDVKNKVIKVRRGVTKVSNKELTDPDSPYELPHDAEWCGCRRGCVVGPPKTDAGVRDVPIPPHVLPDVKTHLKDHTGKGTTALLFPDSSGAHLTPSAFYGAATVYHRRGPKKGQVKRTGHGWYRARQAADRDDLHFHDLRHTGLTNAAVAGATIAELMALAGHSTPAAAMRYQHAASDRMQALAARLSELAEPTSKTHSPSVAS